MADETPTTQEIATLKTDPYVANFQGALEPQDETLRQRGAGKGVVLYDEIRKDPHAFALLQKRSLEVASREWVVDAASDRRVDRKAAEEVERQLRALSFDRLTMGLMGAVLRGYAVAEVQWELRAGVWTAVKVPVRKARRFRFTIDGELRVLTRANSYHGEDVPPRKFICHRFSIDHDDDDPYGLGIGTVLFWPAWFKRQVLSFWLRASEKFAAPTVSATYPGGYDKARQDQLIQALRAMASDAGIVMPEGVIVQLLESKGGTAEAHEKLSRYLDELMSEAVLGETLSTNAGERGARSLGEVHNDVRLAIAKADADLVCATINETLVAWICELNHPLAELPKVWRNFEKPEDLNGRAERDVKVASLGYKPKDVSYINETYGGDWVETAPPAPADPAAPGGGRAAGAPGALDALFAEAVPRTGDAPDIFADQLAEIARPAMAAMMDRIRQAAISANSYDDLAEQLLAIVPDLDVTDLGTVLEQALRVAHLAGSAAVVEEGRADGG